jgi:hypothetical protein
MRPCKSPRRAGGLWFNEVEADPLGGPPHQMILTIDAHKLIEYFHTDTPVPLSAISLIRPMV